MCTWPTVETFHIFILKITFYLKKKEKKEEGKNHEYIQHSCKESKVDMKPLRQFRCSNLILACNSLFSNSPVKPPCCRSSGLKARSSLKWLHAGANTGRCDMAIAVCVENIEYKCYNCSITILTIPRLGLMKHTCSPPVIILLT